MRATSASPEYFLTARGLGIWWFGALLRAILPQVESAQRTTKTAQCINSDGEVSCIITLGGAGMSRIDDFLERIREGLAMEPLATGGVPIAELRTLEITLGPTP